ncbi:leucine-rich repeat protein [Campylobacter showae]|uniref:Uncharacterized protein n=1 Tax=Campylobacter showae CSUNSWCD TaxID=1244083 RepID=M5IN88_9BACT|nr:leucine-rich repeat protein [Campylobacter showae]EKU10139.1 hypothetical protein CSUNSWCD_1503 [Campylobacter showae CSUNSWCD]
MLKGAFFFGGKGEEPYPEVTKIVVENGLNYVLWGNEVPNSFTRTYQNICEAPNYHKNKLDFSKFTKIGANNFNNFSLVLVAPGMTELNLKSLQTLGASCFNNLSGDIKTLKAPLLREVDDSFSTTTLTNIDVPSLETIKNTCFSNNSSVVNDFTFPSLHTITGQGNFCNLSNVFYLTMRKLVKISGANNFKGLTSLSQIVVSAGIDSASEFRLKSGVGASKIRKV